MENDTLLGRNAQLCPFTSMLLVKIPNIKEAYFFVLKSFSITNTIKTFNNKQNNNYVLSLFIPNDGNTILYSKKNKMYHNNAKSYLFDSNFSYYIENHSYYQDSILLFIILN